MKTKSALAALAVVFLIPAGAQQSDFRTFTDSQGRKLEGKATKVAGDQITVIAKNGRSYTLALATLSPEDQQFAKTFLENMKKDYVPTLEVRFQSGKGDRGDKLGDFDDRAQLIRPFLRVTNRDLTYHLENAKITVLTFGKHVDQNVYKVLHKENFTFSIKPGQTAEMECKDVRLQYDDSAFARFGFKYGGYILVVHNQSGKVINETTSPTFKGKGDAALKLEVDALVDRNFELYEGSVY